MAEAPNLTTSKVRLWDRLLSDYNVDSGDGLVLHPETELAAVVMATDSYVVSSGNSLTLNADSVWSGNISGHVASEYCPLSKVVDGNTQYAEMYVSNGTATVTPVPTSTGYGTLINALSTTTSVGPVSGDGSATNDYIPTERAVALALEGKQQVLSGGACITLTPGSNYTAIDVSIQSNVPLPDLNQATQTVVPTEYVVRHAIDVGDAAGSNYAYGLADNLRVSIQNAGYATSAWCINTFALKGEGGSGSSGGSATGDPATYDSLGVVKIAGSGTAGLAITLGLVESGAGELSLVPATDSTLGGVVVGTGLTMSNTSKVRLRVASGNAIGGVMVPSGSGLSLDSSTGSLRLSAAPVGASTTTYANAVTFVGSNTIGGVYVMNHIESATTAAHKSKAIVPTVDAVYSAIDAVTYTFSSGVTETDGTVTLDKATTAAIGGIVVGSGLEVSNGTASLASADYNSFGGVAITESMGIGITDGVISMTGAPVVSTYSSAFTLAASGNFGGVVVMSKIESTDDAYAVTAPIVPTVQAVYDYVSASGGGGGGKPISSGGGITITDSTTYDVLTLNRAGTSSAAYGGVYVPSGSGLGLITATGTSQGKLYLSSATSTALGGVKVPNNSGLSLTNGSLKLSSATTTSIGGVIVPSSSGLTIANGSLGVTSAIFGSDYAEAVAKCSSGNFGGVVLMSSIASGGSDNASHAVVPTVDAVYNALQAVDASYTGPFAVASASQGATTSDLYVNIDSGYVKWLDGNTLVNGVTDQQLDNGAFVYLVGSSGAVGGEKITASSYSATISSAATSGVYTRTTSTYVYSGTTRYKWTNVNGSMWAPEDLSLDTPVYAASNTASSTSKGYVIGYKGSITVGGHAYVRSSTDPMNTLGWYSSGAVKYTASAWPLSGQSTLYNISSSFAYATTTPSLPPAGAFYTMLAENAGGIVKQHQYGTVWHEHWGDDYRGQFAISRVARTTLPAEATMNIGAHPYKYIVGNGGRLYGGIKFGNGRIWAGAIVSGGVIMAPGDIMYPVQSVSIPGSINAQGVYVDSATSSSYADGLYVPYGTTAEVWMNIWSGTWPVTYGGTAQTAVTSTWYTVVHSQCLEGYIPNCYSVQLGWLTPNGAPQQEHRGAISVRGRWT